MSSAARLSPFYVSRCDYRVLSVLWGLARHQRKHYCFPSQKTLLALVAKFTGRVMARSTLNNHLGALERDGFIERVRRHKKLENGELELHSTLYLLKKRTFAWLRSIGAGDKSAPPVEKKSTGRTNPLSCEAVRESGQNVTPRSSSSKIERARGAPPTS